MATLAAMCNRLVGREERAAAPRPVADSYRLRAFPNEDVYFHVKKIDNTKIVRERDPQAGGIAWRSFLLSAVMVGLIIGALLPAAYSMLAGYQISQLEQEQKLLLVERSALELDLAQLLSPERLAALGESQGFVTPAAENVIYLEPKSEGSLAMNQR